MTPLNIGNPQSVGQGTLTFNRQVIAGMMYKDLLKTNIISQDAKNRCEEMILSDPNSPPGAYTGNSKGFEYVRKQVAAAIERRDPGVKSNHENIYLTNGASEGVRTAF